MISKVNHEPTRGGAASLKSPRLQEQLILNHFFCVLFGVDDFKDLREKVRGVRQDYDDDGYSYFYQVLKGLENLQIPQDKLADYDFHIKQCVDQLNKQRTPPIRLLYFQYLALLFTEAYLDRLADDRDAFRLALNQFVRSNYEHALEFKKEDLNKIAFWMATGSGKTLIMHINIWQYLHYFGKTLHDNIMLITPNEGLSKQHIKELRKSGLDARHYGTAGSSIFDYGGEPVTVLEITKLTENKRGKGLSVDVEAFGGNNLLLVDEGHRGASGDIWRDLRGKVAEAGFTFEYSATFGQIVNGAVKGRRPSLLEEYSKAILFDYSYPHFYHDGYGKDYWIVNLRYDTNTFNELMLLGNLLSFYEQCLVFEEHREAFRQYNIEKPLWVFVGHSVTRGSSAENKLSLTDIEQIITFFDQFMRQRKAWENKIHKLLSGETGLEDQRGQDLFSGLFPYLKAKGFEIGELYERIVRTVFCAQPGDALRAVALKSAAGEIGLRVGAQNPYFGVVNIGDVAGMMKKLSDESTIVREEESIGGSLFDDINDPTSPVYVLIGARKFMEGWDSFRVSSMGLMNIGKGEGSQIIQLFGRGVRLHGKDNCLQRTAATEFGEAPQSIEFLEQLNVFGVRANYMTQFREYLTEEGIETDLEKISIPVQLQDEFLKGQLHVLRLPDGEVFEQTCCTVLNVQDSIRVRLDLRPRLEVARSQADVELLGRLKGEDRSDELKKLSNVINWERIFLEILTFKQTRKLFNLSITKAALKEILARGQYEVFCPDGYLPPTGFSELRRVEDVVAGVMRKYIVAFYDHERQLWLQGHLKLQPLARNDPNLSFDGYQVEVKEQFADVIRELGESVAQLRTLDEKQYPHVYFDRHLYLPLLVSQWPIEAMAPPGLNEGELQFVKDLRRFLQNNQGQFEGKELFLLRNLSRGKGIGFFAASIDSSFYPDFILWIVDKCEQWITFIDPHGLIHAAGLSDHKIQLFSLLKELEAKLQASTADLTVHITSFIVAPNTYHEIATTSWVGDYTEEEFENSQVLFQDSDGAYIEKCIRKILHNPILP
jgi:hypothetical protein